MNSYFASVEQHFRPELRNRMVAVIPVESEHTCVIAASHDAKKRGVKVGTRVSDARELCPEIMIVKARPDLYVKVHHAILRSVDQCVPVEKVYSIDEWAIRLLGEERNRENAIAIGRQIKEQLLRDFSPWLTCSVGIAPTRLMAKIASELQKPDGLTVLEPADLPGRLESQRLKDLCGIGEGMLARLHAHGITSIRELWEISRQRSIQIWGSVMGGEWWDGFHGIDQPERATQRRSMSHASVLDPKYRNQDGAYGILFRLVCRLGTRLRHDGYFAQILRVHLKTVRGSGWHDEATLPWVQDTTTLTEHFQKVWQRHVRAVRAGDSPIQVGAEVSGLIPASQVECSLFENVEKLRRVSETVDKINQRWGAHAVYFGPLHEFRHQMDDKIAFGRIPPTV